MIRQLDLLPVLAAIRAAIGPGLRAGIDDLGVRRMHRQRPHRRPLRQAVLQRLPLVGAISQAAETGMHGPARTGFAGQAEIYIGSMIGHEASLPSVVTASDNSAGAPAKYCSLRYYPAAAG